MLFVTPCSSRLPVTSKPSAVDSIEVDSNRAVGNFSTSKKSADLRWPVSLSLSDQSEVVSISTLTLDRVGSPSTRLISPVNEWKPPSWLPVTFEPTVLPSEADPPWRFTGSGMEEAEAVSFSGDGTIEITTGPNQRARWASTSLDGFGAADRQKGFTAEIRMQVLRSTARMRGIDFEAYVGDGAPEGKRYFITVTQTGVYYHRPGGFTPLVEEIDNHSAMHSYRIAAREDGIAQVYRDGELLRVVRPDHSVDGMLRPGGPYLQWGEGAGASEADAVVEHVAFDLGGPSQPLP